MKLRRGAREIMLSRMSPALCLEKSQVDIWVAECKEHGLCQGYLL